MVHFFHVNDVNVYLGRQRGGGVPDELEAFFVTSVQALKFQLFTKQKNYCSLFGTKNDCPKCIPSIRDASGSVYLLGH